MLVLFVVMMCVIELNNVVVLMNKFVFLIGWMVVGDVVGFDVLWNVCYMVVVYVVLEMFVELIVDCEVCFDVYGGVCYVECYWVLVSVVCVKGDDMLMCVVVMMFYWLFVVKDEYEVVWLYMDDVFCIVFEV